MTEMMTHQGKLATSGLLQLAKNEPSQDEELQVHSVCWCLIYSSMVARMLAHTKPIVMYESQTSTPMTVNTTADRHNFLGKSFRNFSQAMKSMR